MSRSSCPISVSGRECDVNGRTGSDARLSLYHNEHPFSMNVNGEDFGVGYWPGDSKSGMFGGNSNWRGPIWLAVNFLLIER